MVSQLRVSLVALAFAACGSERPPQWTSQEAQVEASTSEPPRTSSSGAAQVPAAGQSAPTPANEPACEPCTSECLDQADSLKGKDPKGAKKLAMIACDIAKCGHLGRVMMMRCGEYGLPPPDPVDCQNECIAQCNGEAPRSAAWDQCMKSCETKHGCPEE